MNNQQLQFAVDQAVCQAVRLRMIQDPSAVQFGPGDRVLDLDAACDGTSVRIAEAVVEQRHIDAVMLCKENYPGFAIQVSSFRCAPPEVVPETPAIPTDSPSEPLQVSDESPSDAPVEPTT